MPDTYGAIPFPLAPPIAGVEVADPALTLVAQYAAAVLNTYGQAAYSAIVPSITGLQTGTGTLPNPVVRNAFERDPAEEEFAESDLPAVYAWRTDGDKPYWLAEDYRVSDEHWTLLYLFQPAPQANRTRLKSFSNGVVKTIDRNIEQMRDPSYFAPWDPDPTAPTTPANPVALLQPAPASASPVVVSALNGPVGSNPFAPAQLPTITITGAPCTGVVELSGIGADKQPRISRVTLNGTGTFAGDFQLQQVSSIALPALAPGATVSAGLYGFTGLGTNILLLGGLMKLEVGKWRQYRWKLEMGDTSPPRRYPHAVEITLNVTERWTRDISGAPALSVDTQYPLSGSYNVDPLRAESMFIT